MASFGRGSSGGRRVAAPRRRAAALKERWTGCVPGRPVPPVGGVISATLRGRLDYWTLILGPKFSTKERKQLNLSRFYAIAQIEYCRNFIFKRNFPIHKLFERSW